MPGAGYHRTRAASATTRSASRSASAASARTMAAARSAARVRSMAADSSRRSPHKVCSMSCVTGQASCSRAASRSTASPLVSTTGVVYSAMIVSQGDAGQDGAGVDHVLGLAGFVRYENLHRFLHRL